MKFFLYLSTRIFSVMDVPQKILMVDDDPDDQDIFLTVLREIHPAIQYATASNGLEAVEYLLRESSPPSLILLDINMPVMNGLDCLAKIKTINKFKDIPVVMLTTSSDPPSVKQSLKMGARLFLTKAANLTDIKHQLRMVMNEIFLYI